jgi:protein TonB
MRLAYNGDLDSHSITRLPRRPAQPKPPAAPAPDPAPGPEAVPPKAPRRVAKVVSPPAAAGPVKRAVSAKSTPAAVPKAAAKPVAKPAPKATPKPTLKAAPSPAPRPASSPAPASIPPETPAAHPRPTARIAPAGALPPARIPREALIGPRHDRLLVWAFSISLAIHLAVLAIHFSPVVLKRIADKGPPLEVALVNAKTKDKPTKADILAQANLDGGGNTDANRRAKSPFPVLPKDSPTNEITVATNRVDSLERQTKELLTQLKSSPVAPAQPKPADVPEATEAPTANELMQRTLEAMRLEAQIAKDMDAYQKRPKRRFVGARAEEYRFARYVEDWRLKIERVGNLNYPEAARSQKLYGSLLLTVSIKSDGSVENIEINRSSGHKVLDAAAVKIVEMSGPFSAFPSDVRRDTDILHITRTWTFTKGDELVSQ